MTTDIQLTNAAEAMKPAALYLMRHRSDVGRRGMVSALNQIAHLMGAVSWRDLDWRTISPEACAAIRAQLTGAPASINKALAAVRGAADELFNLRLIDADDLERIRKATHTVKGSRILRGRMVEAWELSALMKVCADDPTPAGARDAAMIAIGAKCGMRREEIIRAWHEDLHLAGDAAELRIIGKGDKQRLVYLDGGSLSALTDWLAIRGTGGGALFYPINKGGVIDHSHGMTTTAAHAMLVKRATQAGVSNIAWHDLRRTVASTLLDQGVDLATVAGILGHARPETTMKYDRRPEADKQRATRLVSVPYFGRK